MTESGASSFCLVVCLRDDLLKDELSGEMSTEVKGLLSFVEVGILFLQQIRCCSCLSGFCSGIDVGFVVIGMISKISLALWVNASISLLENRVCVNLNAFPQPGLAKVLTLPIHYTLSTFL